MTSSRGGSIGAGVASPVLTKSTAQSIIHMNYDTIYPIMNHSDYVNLLRPASLSPGGSWADLGAGAGAFTFALRELVGETAVIHAIDRDRGRLAELGRGYASRFGGVAHLHLSVADFTGVLDLPPLDGILMANSLHFFKEPVLQQVISLLKPGGGLLLVEYNVDSGNPWVPHPISISTWRRLAVRAGFSEPRLLATAPSSFLREFYSATCTKMA